jgi:hypothetical protein
MKIKLKETEPILNALTNLLSKELPIKVSYSFSKLLKKIKSEGEIYFEQKDKLIDQYAEKNENNEIIQTQENGMISIKITNMAEYNSKLEELGNIEFDVEFNPISIDDLKIDTCKGLDLYVLDGFITE